ncbi:hypothetical protein Gotri_001252 [Gossypium trilobum]|uniref:Uncharacterized protein n=1 Tax=Gossypium trilobum TaxID=34281 RepID=A0A7J9FE18_9ROSI|nr:hypothetical protein [Gossypium trilobum]
MEKGTGMQSKGIQGWLVVGKVVG